MDISIDLVLCSSSLRTRKTLQALREALGLDEARCLIEDELYGADEGDLLNRVRRVSDDVDAVLVIGHNPGLQDLALLLCGEEGGEIPRRIEEKFPTAALAILRIRGGWAGLGHGDAEPIDLVLARDLH